MEAAKQNPQLPEDVARYIEGAPPESLQFDFLIGDWTVAGTRFSPEGDPIITYAGGWQAEYRHDKRMVVDDFSVQLPDGREASSFVTIRSYSPFTRRWEITGLGGLQPAMQGEWFGEWIDGEIVLLAKGTGPGGQEISNRIRFYEINPASFQWESHISVDGGLEWMKAASLHAVRRV